MTHPIDTVSDEQSRVARILSIGRGIDSLEEAVRILALRLRKPADFSVAPELAHTAVGEPANEGCGPGSAA